MDSKKNILLTGAGGGLGLHLAEALTASGHRLVLSSRKAPKTPFYAENNLPFIPCDLTDPDAINDLAIRSSELLGGIDAVIHAAGVSGSGMSWKISAEEWQHTLAVNLSAPFLLSAALLPHMRSARFGRIINLSSVVAYRGVAGTSAYAASKAGLDGWVKAMALENASHGITVNNLALGYFDAGMLYDIPEDIRTRIRAEIPTGNFGNPETVSSLILWLLSDAAGYCTGQTIHLNGGLFS
jgi:3-oxoacyl-[acyl-carrier protein] reductase